LYSERVRTTQKRNTKLIIVVVIIIIIIIIIIILAGVQITVQLYQSYVIDLNDFMVFAFETIYQLMPEACND
jgi:heme/copper-type cytochrome/quinol oxidase subunit 2